MSKGKTEKARVATGVRILAYLCLGAGLLLTLGLVIWATSALPDPGSLLVGIAGLGLCFFALILRIVAAALTPS